MLHGVKVVTSHTNGQVNVGCKVTLHINGKKEEFTVVGEWGSRSSSPKRFRMNPPWEKALMGKKVGDKVEVEAPAGKIHYKILNIE